MILRMPAYCRRFKCTAGECKDSCCIGWEIDIDEKTADYYNNIKGSFGDRLRSSMAHDAVYSFSLINERCPFLNENNLCDIILNLGEDKLCHICAEHPRYYEWFGSIKEGGTGLCCEAAAELILSDNNGGFYETEIPDEECDDFDADLYNCLSAAREEIFSLLSNTSYSLNSVLYSISEYTEILQEHLDNGIYVAVKIGLCNYNSSEGKPQIKEITEVFSSLEPIDDKWLPYLEKIRNAEYVPDGSYDRYLRNICRYFVWRYFMKGVFDGEIISKIRLMIISAAMLNLMFMAENADFNRCVTLSKNYSKEVEYSEENLEAVFDMSYTEEIFSTDSLLRFV